MNSLSNTECKPYLNGEIYCNQLIHTGIEPNLLYKPLNIINGSNNAGVNAEALFASLNREPVIIPKLFPTNAHDDNIITLIKNKTTKFDQLFEGYC